MMNLAKKIVRPLSMLKTELKYYFPDVTCAYIANLFSVDPVNIPVGTGKEEELIDIQADEGAKAKNKECSPINFWVSMASTYPALPHHAVP